MQLLRLAWLVTLLFIWAQKAMAQDVTLRSHDGAMVLPGDLLGYDGAFYRLQTRFGEMTVDGSAVDCHGPGCPDLTNFVPEVTLAGPAEIADRLMPVLFRAFAAGNGYGILQGQVSNRSTRYEFIRKSDGKPVGEITLHTSSTEEALIGLLANDVDVAFSRRRLTEAENTLGKEGGLGNLNQRARILALDALVPIVHADNPLMSISPGQLARVLSGEITNWQGLGGPDAPIAVHVWARESELGHVTQGRLLAPQELQLTDAAHEHDDVDTLMHAVNMDPFAIGIGNRLGTNGARILPLDGGCGYILNADQNSIKTGDYPLAAPLLLYLPARRFPKILRNFLTYLSTPAAQERIRAAGYIDQLPDRVKIGQQGNRVSNAILQAGEDVGLPELQTMIRALRPMQRLTTTFRFAAGSARLTPQSRENLRRVADAVEQGRYDNRTLVFVGFSDGQGAAGDNLEIARKRAETVHDSVIALAETADDSKLQLEVMGFGEALPMTCDKAEWGRRVNRRVELWLR